jgi:hypothetical protein
MSEPEKLSQGSNKNKKLSCDSDLSPTFFSHMENCSLAQLSRMKSGQENYESSVESCILVFIKTKHLNSLCRSE